MVSIIDYIDKVDLKAQGFCWKHEQDYYVLWSFVTGNVAKVFKKNGKWTDGKGLSRPTLKSTKSAVIEELLTRSKEVTQKLSEAIGENKQAFDITSFNYFIVSRALDLMVSEISSRIAHNHKLILRGKQQRFANALIAFDVNGHMITLFETCLVYSSISHLDRLIRPHKIGVSCSINISIDQQRLTLARDFGSQGNYMSTVSDLSTLSIERAVIDCIDKASAFATGLKAA